MKIVEGDKVGQHNLTRVHIRLMEPRRYKTQCEGSSIDGETYVEKTTILV